MGTPETIDLEYQPYLPQLIPELPLGELPRAPLNAIAEEVADRLVNITRQEVPVDLDLLARYCCVARIIYENLRGRDSYLGKIEKLPGEPGCYWIIRVIRGIPGFDSTAQQRATIGHEIGHIVAAKIKPLLGREFGFDEREGFCNRFSRILLLPRTLLLQELERMRDRDLHRQCTEIADKFDAPPEFVCKRMVEDLKLFKGILLVIPRKNPVSFIFKDSDRISSNCPPHIFLPDNALIGLWRLIKQYIWKNPYWQMDRVLPVDIKPIGIKNPKNPNWINVYKINGVTTFMGGDEGKVEYAICSIRFGDKIAEVRDDYGGEYICL